MEKKSDQNNNAVLAPIGAEKDNDNRCMKRGNSMEFPANFVRRLSIERAEEYDRICEMNANAKNEKLK